MNFANCTFVKTSYCFIYKMHHSFARLFWFTAGSFKHILIIKTSPMISHMNSVQNPVTADCYCVPTIGQLVIRRMYKKYPTLNFPAHSSMLGRRHYAQRKETAYCTCWNLFSALLCASRRLLAPSVVLLNVFVAFFISLTMTERVEQR